MKHEKLILFIAVFLVSIVMKAHQSDVSTTMIVENENGTWVLQISTSLTAFQQEVRTHFSETPYQSPEEFQQMVIEHIKNNLQLSFNTGQKITLGEGAVILGHETKVVFEVFGMPDDIKSVLIKNTAFKDVHRSKSILLFLKEGFKKERFVMNKDNDFTLSLKVDGNEFVEITKDEGNLSYTGILLVFIVVVAGVFLLIKALPN